MAATTSAGGTASAPRPSPRSRTPRAVLVAEGADGLSLRAIAREMGMTAPALYRYFPSREDLVEHAHRGPVRRAHRDLVAAPATRRIRGDTRPAS